MAKRRTQVGTQATRAHWLEAQRRLEERADIEDPDPNLARDGILPGKWIGAPWDRMPPNCPVEVLGHNGTVTYCRSATGQLHAVERWDMHILTSLFAPKINYLYWGWPAMKKVGTNEDGEPIYKIDRVERDKAMICLVSEGKRRGLFDPEKRVRGRGGWMVDSGAFIWNSGEFLWSVDDRGKLITARPAEHDGYLYLRSPDIDRPWETAIAREESPALSILEDLRTWNWDRPYLDPVLFLGWIACAFMGGALDWRPIVFTTGGAGVGKSTLHSLTQAILGDSLIALVDTTAAGIYQHVKQDSLPVTVDELEAKRGSSKATSIIELARLASSGGKMARGGANHEGTTFQARSSFMFSAILPPPMGVQDKTRMATLNLKRLDKAHGREPVVRDTDGRMILRQIMDGWQEFRTRLLPDWKQTLHKAGFDARAMDTYGTLLAAAELLVGPEALEALGLEISDQERLAEIIRAATEAERAEQTEKWQECLEHLLAATIDAHRSGDRLTVGGVLLEYERGASLELQYARERLALAGLGLRKAGEIGIGPFLAVPAKHPALFKIFQETDFFEGGWWLALKQAPEHIVLRGLEQRYHTIKINRTAKHCLLVDLGAYDAAMPKAED
ncbi:hypothetical protein H1W37_19405 [Stappia taiwanensis]|uniref:DUF927 domain-containing protein n=1 Tax=Stappia taiwanensis TaxID=992267 RepID=A0A838Y4Q9_9HYPH|nr:hypothetical protein [Stappia taiwanensis]MBA4613830.1 hypothetical protein [Stappia taiwanensis]